MRSGVDRAVNTRAAVELIADAAAQGAQFVVTPEMTTAVDRNAARLAAALPVGEGLAELEAFSELAKNLGIWLLIGSAPVKLPSSGPGTPSIANRSFLFGADGRIMARYDKIHMFDVALPHGESWRESSVYAPGGDAIVVKAPFADIGLSICYDLRFPHLYRALGQAGATVFCVPAAFTHQTGKAHWSTLLRARAIECGAFVIAPGQGGRHEDGRDTYGHSVIIGPWGDILAERADADPGVILAEIDPSAAVQARQRIPALTLDQSFEVRTISL